MSEIVVLLHNIRSTHNVGSIFRSADGFGVSKIIFSGYTPHPTLEDDTRLPHFADKITRQIHKTALGAETSIPFERHELPPIEQLTQAGYQIVGLEQDENSVLLSEYKNPGKVALILGNEIDGIYPEYRALCDTIVEIPMKGHKESFNVSVAAGIALYQLSI